MPSGSRFARRQARLEFLGYTSDVAEAVVQALVVDGEPVEAADDGTDVSVVLNQTPFYGESGGQMGDIGTIVADGGVSVSIADARSEQVMCMSTWARSPGGSLKVGDTVTARIDRDHRDRLRANHSATHLLHRALRIRLGDHVVQKGSLVSPDRLRFDISHPKGMTADEISAVQADVNAMIRGNGDVSTTLMAPEEAVKAGALALFGEKYGDEVRVVSMGGIEDPTWSTELCGGTHVRRTGDIGAFHVVSEGAVASGVRRIEALTGQAAIDHLAGQEAGLRAVAGALKTTVQDAPGRVTQLLEERRKLEKELAEARKKAAMGVSGPASGPAARDINGIRYVGQVAEGVPPKQLKGMIDEMKAAGGPGVYALVGVNDGMAALVVGVSEGLLEKTNAVELVRAGVIAIGGKGGGGRPDMAQGGGPDGAAAAGSSGSGRGRAGRVEFMQPAPESGHARRRIFEIVEEAAPGDRASSIFDWCLIGLISLNIAAVVLETVPSIHETFATEFHWFEVFSDVIFSIEYVLRIWVAPEHPGLKRLGPCAPDCVIPSFRCIDRSGRRRAILSGSDPGHRSPCASRVAAAAFPEVDAVFIGADDHAASHY